VDKFVKINADILTEEQKVALNVLDFESKFQTKVIEDTEMFLFTTIQHFCETVTQRKIEKKDLERALIKDMAQSRVYDHGKWKCPSCKCDVYASQEYCGFCGQHMKSIQEY